MRVFVTGATGFVGSAVVRELIDAGHRVLGLARSDAVARLYRLALEKGSAGARYHGIADEGVPVREIAEVIGRRLNVPVVSKSHEEMGDHFGWIGQFFAIDGPASSEWTRKQLGWQPMQPRLLADVDQPYYFAPRGASVA
jgi:nucleoside-diphosphate-sugar epimerase